MQTQHIILLQHIAVLASAARALDRVFSQVNDKSSWLWSAAYLKFGRPQMRSGGQAP